MDTILLRTECGLLGAVENMLRTLSTITIIIVCGVHSIGKDAPIIVGKQIGIPRRLFEAPAIYRSDASFDTVHTYFIGAEAYYRAMLFMGRMDGAVFSELVTNP